MAIDIEAIIQEAHKRGVFDNLPGQGKPLPEDEFKDLPEEIRMTYRVLKNSGFAPSEVNLKRSIEELRNKAREEKNPEEKAKLLAHLNKVETEFNIRVEHLKLLNNGSMD